MPNPLGKNKGGESRATGIYQKLRDQRDSLKANLALTVAALKSCSSGSAFEQQIIIDAEKALKGSEHGNRRKVDGVKA